MGLFVNKVIGNVYKNNEEIKAPNQETLRMNQLSELMTNQEKTNKQLSQSIAEIKPQFDQLQENQIAQWNQLKVQLSSLEAQEQKRENFERMMIDRVTEMINRLEKQEALTDKIFHQLNHLRSILYERTNYLATKIEEGYALTSSYVYKILTRSDSPIAFSLIHNKPKKQPTDND